jgi:hypothetical protein
LLKTQINKPPQGSHTVILTLTNHNKVIQTSKKIAKQTLFTNLPAGVPLPSALFDVIPGYRIGTPREGTRPTSWCRYAQPTGYFLSTLQVGGRLGEGVQRR